MHSRMSPQSDKIADQIHAFAIQMTQQLSDDEYLVTMNEVIKLLNESLAFDTASINEKKGG